MKQQADDDGRVKVPMTLQLCLAEVAGHVAILAPCIRSATRRVVKSLESPWGLVPDELRHCDQWRCRMDRTLS